MTLKFEIRRDFCTMHLSTKFHRPMFNRSEVIMLTNKQTNKQTNPQTDATENIHLACYATPVENYTVSTKRLYPCIRCHNSGKQRRILTKFYVNTETLNCKQVTKFQQNWSTSATATASLVRSLKSISVHYRHRRD